MNIETNSEISASCEHFNECGGCSLQHLAKTDYYSYKQSIVTKIIDEIGANESSIKPLIKIGAASRRRAEFKISVNKGNIQLGFYKHKSHDIVDIKECPVSETKLVTILPKLRKTIGSLKQQSTIKTISLTLLENGLDCTLTTSSSIKPHDKDKLIEFSKESDIIRLSDGENILYDNCNAYIKISDHKVNLPLGAFLQATRSGQDAITNLVIKHLKDCNNIADLYSGCGTYSFPLLKSAKHISAFEGNGDMVAAMHNAIINSGIEGKITASTRDLYKRPLKEYELKNYDGLVINPPRNGSLPQAKNIAQSNIERLVMVSCNPATFKRDAKELINNGYKISSVTAIDQFYWTHHLEIVASFTKI